MFLAKRLERNTSILILAAVSDSEKLLRAFTILLQSGVRPNQDGNFAVQMVAMETGHVSVKLEVTPLPGRSQILGDLTLRDELQIQVRI